MIREARTHLANLGEKPSGFAGPFSGVGARRRLETVCRHHAPLPALARLLGKSDRGLSARAGRSALDRRARTLAPTAIATAPADPQTMAATHQRCMSPPAVRAWTKATGHAR